MQRLMSGEPVINFAEGWRAINPPVGRKSTCPRSSMGPLPAVEPSASKHSMVGVREFFSIEGPILGAPGIGVGRWHGSARSANECPCRHTTVAIGFQPLAVAF